MKSGYRYKFSLRLSSRFRSLLTSLLTRKMTWLVLHSLTELSFILNIAFKCVRKKVLDNRAKVHSGFIHKGYQSPYKAKRLTWNVNVLFALISEGRLWVFKVRLRSKAKKQNVYCAYLNDMPKNNRLTDSLVYFFRIERKQSIFWVLSYLFFNRMSMRLVPWTFNQPWLKWRRMFLIIT